MKYLKDFLFGKAGCKEIVLMAYPLIILSASHSIMQFCDRKFLAENSSIDVAAALPAGIMSFTFFSFFMVTINFTSAIVSQYYGSGNKESCIRAVWSGFYLSLAAAVLILIISPFAGLWLIEIAGHMPEVMSKEKIYFLALVPSGAFVCMGAAFFSYFSGQGKTWYSAVINSCACVLNVILAYIMIFGKLGCPSLGIMGAGIATTISLFINFITIFLVFIFQDQSKHPTRKYCKLDFNEIKRLFSFGTPSGLQVFLEVGAFTLFCFLVGDLGVEALASTTIVLAINNLSFLPLLGLMDATAIICGQYIGKNDLKTAEKVAFRAWFVAIFYMLFACSVYIFLPSWLMGNFAPKHLGGDVNFQEVFDLGRQILICAAIFNFFDATKFIFMGALRGAGDTLAILVMGTAFSWFIFVPGVLIMIKVFHTPVIYVWIFMTCYILVEGLVYFWRFKSEKWKKIDMINKKSPQSLEEEPINENMPPV